MSAVAHFIAERLNEGEWPAGCPGAFEGIQYDEQGRHAAV